MRATVPEQGNCRAEARKGSAPRGRLVRPRRWVILLPVLALAAMLCGAPAWAKEMERPVRIGVLTPGSGIPPAVVHLRDGMHALGYVEARDFVLGVRFTSEDMKELEKAARQLHAMGSDLIFSTDFAAALAAKKAVPNLPLVFVTSADPVTGGLIDSFRHPGGNVTGVTGLISKYGPKGLELFHRLHPQMKRIYLPVSPVAWKNSGRHIRRELDRVADQLGFELHIEPVRDISDAKQKLHALRRTRADGIFLMASHLGIGQFSLEASARERIPVMVHHPFFLERGGFALYGADYPAMGRQAARLVDKIIRGKSAGDIPVEVSNKLELAINLRVAKKLGIEIPKQMLYRADRIIR